jgi:hypothetical protein
LSRQLEDSNVLNAAKLSINIKVLADISPKLIQELARAITTKLKDEKLAHSTEMSSK